MLAPGVECRFAPERSGFRQPAPLLMNGHCLLVASRLFPSRLVATCLATASIGLIGCSGGSSGESSIGPSQGVTGPNGPISGRLYFDGLLDEDYLDLSTGRVVDIEQGDSFIPRADGRELTSRQEVQIQTDCYFLPLDHERIGIHDALTGDRTSYFDVRGKVDSPTLSPDGSMVVMGWADDTISDGPCELQTESRFFTETWLFTRAGVPVRRMASDIVPMWLSDTEVLVLRDDVLFRVSALNEGQETRMADLGAVGEKVGVDHFSRNPVDGTLVFEVIRRNSAGSVSFRFSDIWTLNDDGSGLRQLLSSRISEQLNVPMWAPDGDQLLVAQDAAGGGVILENELDEYDVEIIPADRATEVMYAIPRDRLDETLPPARFTRDGIRPIVRLLGGSNDVRFFDVNPGVHYWLAPSPVD